MKSSLGPTVGFVLKVAVVSAAVSVLIKLVGVWLPVTEGPVTELLAPDEMRLNQMAIAIVLLPATIVGMVLAVALKRS